MTLSRVDLTVASVAVPGIHRVDDRVAADRGCPLAAGTTGDEVVETRTHQPLVEALAAELGVLGAGDGIQIAVATGAASGETMSARITDTLTD
jgi:hypothetical protein